MGVQVSERSQPGIADVNERQNTTHAGMSSFALIPKPFFSVWTISIGAYCRFLNRWFWQSFPQRHSDARHSIWVIRLIHPLYGPHASSGSSLSES